MTTLSDLVTPALVLDRGVLDENLAMMQARADRLGVVHRPHLKTAKSVAVANRLAGAPDRPVCVSTIEEAAYFFAGGFADLCCPNVVVPAKVRPFAALARRGATITLAVADPATVGAIAETAAAEGVDLRVLVEVESGAARTGLPPDSPLLLETAGVIHAAPRLTLAGIMTYGGQGYAARSREELCRIAALERDIAVGAAARLRAAGLPCPTVSVGSTPTSTHADDLTGVTEIRPGVYMFFDMMQVGLGVAKPEQLALSVLATVVFSDPESGRIVVDAGALALSKDGGEASPSGHGLVLGLAGEALAPGLRVHQLHQEHGILAGATPALAARLPVGSRVRILPHHVCLTAAPYDRYHVVDGGTELVDVWPKLTGTYA
jgi:D-serine deaminase-like pyridoxal phosphate-dependent protein